MQRRKFVWDPPLLQALLLLLLIFFFAGTNLIVSCLTSTACARVYQAHAREQGRCYQELTRGRAAVKTHTQKEGGEHVFIWTGLGFPKEFKTKAKKNSKELFTSCYELFVLFVLLYVS